MEYDMNFGGKHESRQVEVDGKKKLGITGIT